MFVEHKNRPNIPDKKAIKFMSGVQLVALLASVLFITQFKNVTNEDNSLSDLKMLVKNWESTLLMSFG